MKKYIYLTLWISSVITGVLQAQCSGTSGSCNGNTFLQSSDPNTIEYDNMISTFHSTLVKEASGKVMTWGESTANNGSSSNLSPTEINSTNYPNLTGNILKMAGGSGSQNGNNPQFALLTTDGLFVWGRTTHLVASGIKSNNTFSRVSIGTTGVSDTNPNGMPQGVSPENVKMMFGTYQTLVLTTCSGDVWVLSMTGSKNGDGTTDTTSNTQVWHRVKTGPGQNEFLTDVVATRGTSNSLIALTSTGKLYTWGSKTLLGDGSPFTSREYATEMTLPSDWPVETRPKMIGMTMGLTNPSSNDAYYLLASNGFLYSMGENNERQLGDFTTTRRTNWVRVKKNSTEDLTDVAWISPQEHDRTYAAINILTNKGELYAWGHNHDSMLGMDRSNVFINPTYMPGRLNSNDFIMAVETGGHTSMVVKKCSQNFGYVGHKVAGSMADGTSNNSNLDAYSFSTAKINLCGAVTQPDVIPTKKTCAGNTVDLNDNHIGTIPQGYELKWYTTSTRDAGTEVTNPGAVGSGTYYAFYTPTNTAGCDNPPASDAVVVSYFVSGDPEYKDCSCKKPITTGIPLASKFGISTKESVASNWPNNVPNGHIVLDSAQKGLVITHMTTAQINALTPVAGMIVYDTDAKCVKLYRGETPTIAPDRKGWVCIQKGCND